jgi:hypothetical protein
MTNIYGYKKKIAEAKKGLSDEDISFRKSEYFKKQIRSWKNCIKKIRDKKKKK